jgi:hypothetical protein
VHDQWVVGRSALGGKDLGGGEWIEGKGTEAIDRLCWKSDDITLCQVVDGSLDGILSLWIREDGFVMGESD